MNRLKYFCMIVIVACMISCEKAPMDILVQQGEIISESRSLPFFDKVKVEDVFDVYMINDSVFKIEIIAGENIAPKISTVVKDSILYIRNDMQARWSRAYKKPVLHLYFPSIYRFYLLEPSNLYTIDTLRCENLTIYALADLQHVNVMIKSWNFQFRSSHTASGEYIIKGWTWNSYLSAYAGCIVDAGELETHNTTFVNHSIGNFTVTALNTLEGEIYNTGNVLYKGNPGIVKVDSYSSGKAIKIN